LNAEPRVQDVPFIDSRLENGQALRVEIELADNQQMQPSLPTLVVTQGGSKTKSPPLEMPNNANPKESDSDSSSTSSNDSPRLIDLQDTLQKATKEVKFDPNPVLMKFDEDE